MEVQCNPASPTPFEDVNLLEISALIKESVMTLAPLSYPGTQVNISITGPGIYVDAKEQIFGKEMTNPVISSAVKKDNGELIAARHKKLSVFKRGEMLANIVALKKNIVITGSHGKTTTTSLVAIFLEDAGLDPTIINGGVINSLKNNAQLGKGEWAVIASDESDGSFLKLPVTYSIVTNVDKELLDFYGSFD